MRYGIQSLVAVGLSLASLVLVTADRQARSQDGPTSDSLVVRGGTVVDIQQGKLLPNTDIVIQGERITQVGPTGHVNAPAGAQVITATGKFVLPGLWDTHAHTRDYDGALNIHFGVTSTMDMGNLMDWILSLQEAREKEMSFGPRVYPAGMAIGGKLGPHEWNVKTPEEARWAARQNIAAGVSFLKVYQEANCGIVKAVAEEAHNAGLNLHGHLRDCDARGAVLAGINAIAHESGVAAATTPPAVLAENRSRNKNESGGLGLPEALEDSEMFDDLIKLMVDKNVRLEPNIVGVFHGAYPQWDKYELEQHRLSRDPSLGYLPEIYVRMWFTDFTFHPYPPTPELHERLLKALANHQLFARKFVAGGGKILVGTDNYYHVPAGIGVWEEMELLAEAQIPNLAILQGATINPALFVHQDKNLGTIEVGKLADMDIFNKNPLDDITYVRTLETVIQHGKVQDRVFHSDYREPIPRPYLPVNGELPRPYISSVQPSAVPIGTRTLTLTIKGRDFNALDHVMWQDVELKVTSFSPTEINAVVPDELLRRAGTNKVQMITGGRVHQPSYNFQEVMVTFGRKFDQRWNGQNLSVEF
jgi:imidazolonepropionase-like amidohydrolase